MINRFIEYFIILITVFIISSSSILGNWIFKLPFLFLVIILFLAKAKGRLSKKFLTPLVIFSVVWLGVNYLAKIMISNPLDISASIYFLVNIVLVFTIL